LSTIKPRNLFKIELVVVDEKFTKVLETTFMEEPTKGLEVGLA